MARRRMFSLDVVDTDKFCNMSLRARYLYYELAIRADDDGFIGAPNKIIRMVECTNDDLVELENNGFVIPFESGVIVITDWKQNNDIRKQRYTPTIYSKELGMLDIVNNKYVFKKDIPNVIPVVLPNVIPTEDTGKDRLGKDSKGNNILSSEKTTSNYSSELKEILDYMNAICGTSYKATTKKTISLINARLSEGFTVEDFKKVIAIKYQEWGKDEKMKKYLRPETLFGTKFEGYLNQSPSIRRYDVNEEEPDPF